MKQAFFIGVDGGGTKTQAVVIDEKGKEIAKGVSGGSNPSVVGINESVKNIDDALKQALLGKKLTNVPAVFAIAGINTEEGKNNLKGAISATPSISCVISKNFEVVNDALAALRAGTADKNAIVVIAGTGSSCVGGNENGKHAKSGGMDYILSDEGSGYFIGLSVLKAVTKSSDGREAKTKLVDMLFKKLKIKSIEELDLLVYKKPWNKTDIASVAPLAEIATEIGDPKAKQIIETASRELGQMIKAVVKKLELVHKPYTIVTTGSVFKIQKILCENLERDILKFSPEAKFTKPQVDSATGAAYLAKEGKDT